MRTKKLRKRNRWGISLLISVMMVASLIPMTAFADGNDKAIQMGTAVLATNVNESTAATVYYGKNPFSDPRDELCAWRVIGYGTNGMQTTASTTSTMTLFASDNMYSCHFNLPSSENNRYSGSSLKTIVDTIAENLTAKEQAAVVKRTLKTGEYRGDEPYCDGIAGDPVTDALLWPLSTAEASSTNSELKNVSRYWWLRSPGDTNTKAAFVDSNGIVARQGAEVNSTGYCVRPAFNLNLNSVLFTSAATDGKASGTVGATTLTAVGTNSGNEWKLTLIDSTRSNFKATSTTRTGDTLTVSYEGATTGTNEYISAIVKDSSDDIKYYGRIKALSADGSTTGGTVDIDLSRITLATGDTLNIFNEQYNGDKQTDYASELNAVTVPIKYEITEGAYGQWTKGSMTTLDFKANADYSKFSDVGSVSVDETMLDYSNYTSEIGSTVIKLNTAYLESLSVGQHTLRIDFTDGFAET
ncbi:MAG: DUF6273 domain-containing protein, partial [Bacillota bacterium]|nr:DUF6273 domain-containing protein [Bacillota bacterium]